VVLEYSTPRVVAFDMKKTLDSFMDSVSQKQLTEAQSKALSDRFNDALEKSLAEYQQQHHVVILVSPAVVQGARCDPQHPARHCPPDERRTVMIRLKGCLLAACLLSPLTQAADLGTWGIYGPSGSRTCCSSSRSVCSNPLASGTRRWMRLSSGLSRTVSAGAGGGH
jgi:type-F conjugative transfer system protein TrbI